MTYRWYPVTFRFAIKTLKVGPMTHFDILPASGLGLRSHNGGEVLQMMQAKLVQVDVVPWWFSWWSYWSLNFGMILNAFLMKEFSQFGELSAVDQIRFVIQLNPAAFTLISMDLRPSDRYPSPPGINPAESLEHRMWDVDNHGCWNRLISSIHHYNSTTRHHVNLVPQCKWLPFVGDFC